MSAYIESKPLTAPSIKQHLTALRGLFNWLVVKQVVPDNPALSSGAEIQPHDRRDTHHGSQRAARNTRAKSPTVYPSAGSEWITGNSEVRVASSAAATAESWRERRDSNPRPPA
jgi:hypothetical protein